jgi:hypothetical protein
VILAAAQIASDRLGFRVVPVLTGLVGARLVPGSAKTRARELISTAADPREYLQGRLSASKSQSGYD